MSCPPARPYAASEEEVAEELSREEGRAVSIEEVRFIECNALRKLRKELLQRGLHPGNLLPE